MSKTIYYLPGRGGELTTGLGEGLRQRGCAVTGRGTIGAFKELSFQEQIDTICADLKGAFWTEDAYLVAVSYGAYLFLHAQAQLPPYPGRVLILSPIIGQFSSDEIQLGFIPPRAHKLGLLAAEGKFPTPAHCQIHVGSEDWQSNPGAVMAFGELVRLPVNVAAGRGHQLGVDYVGPLLDVWLGN